MSISRIIGIDNMNTARRILPEVNSCSFPVIAILKYLNNCFIEGVFDNIFDV